jgi:uncharacterized membrane protein
MPYCSQCGTRAGEGDAFCAKCGARQPVTPRASHDMLGSLSPKTASTLCYVPVVGWIAAVIVLAADRFRQDRQVRFHAFQGLYLFVTWLIAHHVLRPIWDELPDAFAPVDKILEGLLVFAGIFMLVKTSHEENYSLPILGELAHKSVAER